MSKFEVAYEPPTWNVAQVVSISTPASHIFRKNMPLVFVTGVNDIYVWCGENCVHRWRWCPDQLFMEFESKDDASYFILVWG